REMLVATRFADTVQVHQVSFPGGDRRQLTFFPDRVISASFPPRSSFSSSRASSGAPSSDSFVFSKDRGGDEFFQNYRYDVASGTTTLISDGRSRNSLGVWSNRGDRMAYTSTRRNGADTDLYVVVPTEPKTDRLFAQVQGGGWSPLDWSPDDSTLLVSQTISINESHLWLFDVATGTRTLLTAASSGNLIAYRGGKWARAHARTSGANAIYVATDRDGEFFRLAGMDTTTKAIRYLTTHIPWDVESFDLSPDGKSLAVVTNEAGVGKLHMIDAATGTEWPISRMPTLPAGSISDPIFRTTGAATDLAFTITSAGSPADVYSWDVRTRKIQRWTHSETGGIDTRALSEPAVVQWPTFDGRLLSGLLYKPPARFAGKRPVMISIHGGPEAQSRPGFQGRTNFILAELGVAVLFPNVRGSTGYGKSFTRLDNGLLREDAVKDIGTLLDWIATQPDLDSDRIMIAGGSYGGYMTLAASTHFSARIRCSLSIVGISNFVTFLERTEAYRRDLRRVEYGDEREPDVRAFMERIAPLNNAAKIAKPIFVVQGKNDPRVPLREAEQMVATLRK
ncbi:MAG: S9 family peptidase, partial [Deltaproteobacteria bacterium]|nr:S9 family peptidase [Deltaproteobacteria bacterium]